MNNYNSVSAKCPADLSKVNPSYLNPDGEILYVYPGYTDFRPMKSPVKNEQCPQITYNRKNLARLESLDFEYQANELLDGEEDDQAAIDAFKRVEERLYIIQPKGGSPKEDSKRGLITCVSPKSARRLQKNVQVQPKSMD